MKKNILSLLFIANSLANADEENFKSFPTLERGDVSIYEDVTGGEFDPGLPRNMVSIPVDQVIRSSDNFLKRAFGEEFSAPIRKISFDRHMGKENQFVWCWIVTYFDPKYLNDSKSARIFHVYLDLKGNPLMGIGKK